MTDVRLTDNQGTKIREFLKQDPNTDVGSADTGHRFVEAVKWISRSGAQWRLLPAEYGNWNSIYKRFTRWCDKGVWERMLEHVAAAPAMENGLVDSTVVRAHASAAGATKNGDQAEQALGRSRGGFSTKLHVTVDGLGYPLRLHPTAGQHHDLLKAHDLTVDLEFDHLLVDRSYGAQAFVEELLTSGIEGVIPPNKNAQEPRE